MMKTAVMKLLTVKAAAVVALTAAGGGVAVAATTGTLPTMLTGSDHQTSGLSTAGSHESGKPSPKPSAGEKGKDDGGKDNDGKGSASAGPNGSPSPSLVGLCHAVSAGNKDDHGKALENPAFTALITAAGGKTKVDLFCTTLLASAAAAHPGQSAESSSGATDHRTGPPSDHGTGKPSANAHHS
jgi:hypothetical protein